MTSWMPRRGRLPVLLLSAGLAQTPALAQEAPARPDAAAPAAPAPADPGAASPGTPAPASPSAATPPRPPPAAREELPRLASQRVIGREVTGPSGDVVGRIVNVLMDDAGQPRAAVLDYGGFLGVGRRRVAVAWRTLSFSPEVVKLALTRDQIRAFPDYKEGESVVVAAPPEPPPAAEAGPGAPAPDAPAPEAPAAAPEAGDPPAPAPDAAAGASAPGQKPAAAH